MVEKTYSSDSMPEGLTIKQWKELIDRALAVSDNRGGALHDIAKGTYVPIPKLVSKAPESSLAIKLSHAPYTAYRGVNTWSQILYG